MVGRYAIFDEIASGGMATVFLGRLVGSGGFTRTVAIKRLHPPFARDPEFVSMFLDEARLAARIRHPNVVPTLDVVASKGEVFLVMEYIQGESLSRLARTLRERGERVPLPVLMRIMSDALQGLHAAHEARDERGVPLNIVHRDVTPQNILVGIDGVARLLDFGVAKAAGRAQTTREGQIKGKLAYMAPEQLMGTGVTRETDVYAAAVVLWEMLAGERLFSGGSEVDVVAKLLNRNVRPPGTVAPGIPAALDELVMKGLAAKVEDRFGSARAMCLGLAGCGVQEAPALAVGEWVESLAAGALADRTAKIAAIETNGNLKVHSLSSLRPEAPSSPPPAPAEVPRPTIPVGEDIGHKSGETALTITMSTGAIRLNSRMRAVGTAAAAVAALGLLGVLLSVRSSRPSPAVDSTKPALLTSGGSAASAPPAAASQLDPAPAPAAVAPPPAAAPGPSAELAQPTAAAPSVRPSAAAAGPPSRRTATAASPSSGVSGRSASPQRPKEGSGADVFDSRE
jgi:serine/threonine-protein kinase